MQSNPKKVSGKLLYNIALTLAMLFLLFQNFRQKDKICYVESSRLLNEYKGAEASKKTYEEKAKSWKLNIDTLTAEVQDAINKYEREAAGMSLKEQTMARQSINGKRKELADYQRAIQENAGQEHSRIMQSVVSQINKFLLDYGKKHGYKMILIANQSGTIAYAADGLDITNKILEELNDEYSKSSRAK